MNRPDLILARPIRVRAADWFVPVHRDSCNDDPAAKAESWRAFPVGPEGREYLLETLSSGLTLGRLLRDVCEREPGTVSGRLPVSDRGSVRDFEVGRTVRSAPEFEPIAVTPGGPVGRMLPIPDCDADMARQISAFLRGDVARVCVFENYLARPGDPWLRSAVSRISIMGDEVYHRLSDPDTDVESVATAIREAKSIPVFIGALSSLPVDRSGGGARLDPEELALLAHRAETVIFGAYDGEGYLVWSRASDRG